MFILSEKESSRLGPSIFCWSPRIIFFLGKFPVERALHKGSAEEAPVGTGVTVTANAGKWQRVG